MDSLRTKWLAAAGLFLLMLLRPVLIVRLRHGLARADPPRWSQNAMNGSFAILLPELFATRYHDEALYSARVRQIFLHGTPSDPYWREDKGRASWIHDCLSLYLLAGAALLCGESLTLGWILAAALVAAGWFFLFYAIFKWWSAKEEVAVPLALFSILFPDLYTWLLDVNFNVRLSLARYAAVFFQHNAEIRPNFYRLPSNFLSMLLLGLCLLAAWRLACRKEKRALEAALVGGAFGLLTLVHAYAFVFAAATLGVLAVAVWLLDRGGACKGNLAVALGTALATTAVYAAVMAGAVDPQTRADSLEIIGLVHSRKFYFITLIHPLFAALGWAMMRRESDEERRTAWLLLACSQAAIFCCRNAQVLTGALLQPFHLIPLGSFTGTLMLALLLAGWLSRRRWWDRRMGLTAAVILFAWGLANEFVGARKTYLLFGFPRDIEAALAWVRQNLTGEPLIVSLSMETNELVPIYTAGKVQVPPAAPNNSAPFTKEKYFFKVAQLLKTVRADPDAFLSERFPTPGAKAALIGRIDDEMNLLERVDLAAFEPAEWFYQFWWNTTVDKPFLEARARIKALYQDVPFVASPYYLWVNAKDVHLLRRDPAAAGGRLIYENPAVKIYAF